MSTITLGNWRSVNQQSGTTYTLAATDVFKTVECSNAGNITVTVPANSTTPFATGTIIRLRQTGFGGIIVAPAGGVTINSPLSKLALYQKYSEAWLEKVGTDTWQLAGDLVYSGTNLFTKTEVLDNAVWDKENVTVTADSTTAPDGTSTADKVLETTANGGHAIRNFQLTKAASRIRYTFSCFFKGGLGRDILRLSAFNSGFTGSTNALFDITAGLVFSSYYGGEFCSDVAPYVVDCGSGWFRCCVPFVTDTDTVVYPIFNIRSANVTESYTGDVAKGVYAWGAQIEAQPEAGIYKVVA